MIVKECQFPGRDDNGTFIHLLYPGHDNDHLVKEAQVSPPQLQRVQQIMKQWPKQNGHVPALISAMGAGEYWGSNSNGDDFPEDALIHVPEGWDDMSWERQRAVGKSWEWGYPTFYNAYAYQHHVNKDPKRAFGDVIYAMWDNHMKRVLLVIDFDRERAIRQGAQGVLDRLENGEFPDVSMGCKVPFDVCSICADWSRIIPLMGTPKRLLAEHKRAPIRGISTTRKDYCQHLQFELNKIYPDGRKVRMINLHPRFFDLSVVFIGADKTSKIMAKLAGERPCPIRNDKPMCKHGCYDCAIPSSHVYEVWSNGHDKVAAERETVKVLSPDRAEEIAINQKRYAPAVAGTMAAVPGAMTGGAIGALSGKGRLGTALGAGLGAAATGIGTGLGLKRMLDRTSGTGKSERRAAQRIIREAKRQGYDVEETGWLNMDRKKVREILRKAASAQAPTGLSDTNDDAVDFAISDDKVEKANVDAKKGKKVIRPGTGGIKVGATFPGLEQALQEEAELDKLGVGPSLGRVLRPTLVGAGTGAAVGGVGGGIAGSALEDDLEDKEMAGLKGALMGAAGGAATGAGVGSLVGRKGLQEYVAYKPARELIRQSEKELKTARGFAAQVDDAVQKAEDPGIIRTLKDAAEDYAKRSEASRKAALEKGREIMSGMEKSSSEEDPLAELFGIDKTAALSMAKKAEIIKEIRSNFSKAMPALEESEPELPKDIQDTMARCLPDALASAGSLGIVAKPREFQRMILIARGRPQLADDLDEQGICFRPGGRPDGGFRMGQIIPRILQALAPLIGDRSALAPPIHRRIIRVTIVKKRPDRLPEELEGNPVLEKISSAYSDYRQQLLYKSAHLVRQMTHEHPWVVTTLFEDFPERSFSGGLVKAGGDVMESLIGMFPIDYLNQAHLDTPVSAYVDDRCDLAGLEAAGDLASCGKVA